MKSKFETARDEKCSMYYKNEKSIAFKIGADWGAAYERERAAKLQEFADDNHNHSFDGLMALSAKTKSSCSACLALSDYESEK